MRCPFCGYEESKVVDSRPTDEGRSIRRRRECLRCQKRFTSYEIIETVPLIVIKKDGSRQHFDGRKLLNGFTRACEKRPVPTAVLEKAVNEIETELYNSLEREITTEKIGEIALHKLRDIDEVAYIRFASVYREFDSLQSFTDELRRLKKDAPKKA